MLLRVNVATLSEKQKTGACPELANLDKRRVALFQEVSSKTAFNNCIVKAITGGGKLCVRGLYEKETQKTIHATFIAELNKDVPLTEEVGVAEANRFIEIILDSYFTLFPDEVKEEKHIYLANIEYILPPFIEKHKRAFMKVLMDWYKIYAKNGYLNGLKIPKKVEKDTKEYLQNSSKTLRWFKGVTKKKQRMKNDFVKLRDIFNRYKDSGTFKTLAQADKQSTVEFVDFIKVFTGSPFYSKFYKKELHPAKGGHFRDVLLFHQQLPDEDEIEEEKKPSR